MNVTACLRRFSNFAGAAILALPFVLTVVGAKDAPPKPEPAQASATLTPGGGKIVIEARGLPPEAPLFFSASADHLIRVGATEILGEIKLAIRVIQGKAETLTFGLSGDGDVISVTGPGLRDWSVRQGAGDSAGKRFLILRPAISSDGDGPKTLELVARTRMREPAVPGKVAALIISPGDAVGYSSRILVQPEPSVDMRLAQAVGVVVVRPAADPQGALEFVASGDARIELALSKRGAALAEAELTGAQLTGRVNETSSSVDFQLRGQARVERAGARLRLLSGRVALTDRAAGDGWRVELVRDESAPPRSRAETRLINPDIQPALVAPLPGEALVYEIVFEKKGVIPVELAFVAALREQGDWRRVEFLMPSAAVVPVTLTGLATGVEFDVNAAVVPISTATGWHGFLPSNGAASLAWKRTRDAGVGTLFFTSSEESDVEVGAGLLRQASQLSFRILQGKLSGIRLRLEGPGEIVGVEGNNVVGWKVLPAESAAEARRTLEVQLSRPLEGEGKLLVKSQSALGGFPVRAEPVRLTPEGVVRHSGFTRVVNRGAVRLEVVDVEGMMQLAPQQFPGKPAAEGVRQIFVYRFPAAGYSFRVLANQILSEVGISEVVTYELTETDRVIQADFELDIREAPLREWSLSTPQEFAVVAVKGADVADYVVESVAQDGYRALKIIFSKPVEGRQLLHVRLEKNQTASAGGWTLPPLRFPGAKSARGHIGVVSVPGYRIVPGSVQRLVEVPLSYFPKQMSGLQQAYRLRDADWQADVKIEALGQSVQADVFHLYSLKEGVTYGSVLINYFVIGAPANEWRIEVPQSVGNIDVTGQGVRRDWRREGNQVVVSLHQPVLGSATVLVTFEEPMSARGGVIKPGEVRPLGVQAERGFLQIVSPLQVKPEIRKADGGLLKLEPLELPVEYRLFTNSPSLAVYQYTARPFALEMKVDWYEPAQTVDQVIDFAKLSSQVSRDGQVVTDARFFVKTRGRKALRLRLPDGVKLWEARADNEVVNARADGPFTLVPLSARLNPNEPVEVALRLGQAAGASNWFVSLEAPKMAAPMVIGEWILRSDAERLLTPTGGTAVVTRSPLTETGFEWISEHGRVAVIAGIVLAILSALALVARSARWLPFSFLAAAATIVLAGVMSLTALTQRRVNVSELHYAASVVPADGIVSIEVSNLPAWASMISIVGVACVLAALGVWMAAWKRARRGGAGVGLWVVAGVLLFGFGLLQQRAGAAPFFLAGALSVFIFLIVPASRRGLRAWRERKVATPPEISPPPLVSAIILAIGVGFAGMGSPSAQAQKSAGAPLPAPTLSPLESGVKAAQAMSQRWEIRDGRIFAELDLTVRGGPGESFLLLRPPAVLTEFVSDGLRVGKVERDGGIAYYVTPERDSTLTARVKFEMPASDLTKGFPLPTGPAAVQRLTIQLDQGGWEFTSPMAAQVQATTGLGDNRSGATLLLGTTGAPVIFLTPKRRDLSAEATQFFVEASTLYVPGPGVVNGYARATVRPVQGRVTSVDVDVPSGYTVGDVGAGPVGSWRFDPEKRRLRVAVEPAQAESFSFVVELQRGASALPFDLSLRPVKILGAASEVGMLAVAFGNDAQPEAARPTGLSAVNTEDFDDTLLPRGRDRKALAVLQNVYRYSQDGGELSLRVAAVAPEARVESKQLLSLGDDRLVLAIDLAVAITRVGLFKLSFELPQGLEVEALGGPALSHWTEAAEGGKRIVTLHLNGRTLGNHTFSMTLVGPAPAAQENWRAPVVRLREATRQTGEIQIVPEKGLRLRATDRKNVSQLDPRAAGNPRPGALAFRLLQENWSLALALESLEAWVTAQSLQETTVREGQTLTRIAVRYRVENAVIKQLRVRLLGLSEEQVRTLRATGSAVSDFVPVPGEPGLWEIRFQRGIAGETDVQIEFQGQAGRGAEPTSGGNPESPQGRANDGARSRELVATPVFEGARQVTQFVSVRSAGRLELEAPELPQGWQRVDWSAVPVALQDRGDRSVPALSFRVAEPEKPLMVSVRRHAVADALKLRVTGAELTTVLSPSGPFLTTMELTVEMVEKSTLRVRLPKAAQLYNTFVNGESVSLMREGDEALFHVWPSSGSARTAAVRIVYSVPVNQNGDIDLTAPGLSVPLENVRWRVAIPAGYVLDDYQGGLRLQEDVVSTKFGLSSYSSQLASKRATEAQKATELLQQANTLLQSGQQQLAGEALRRVSKTQALDEATNEDARVQLRMLKTQQAVIGLNTRRQRLYLDNSADTRRNEQLEQAAHLNPFMQGQANFDPKQIDQLLMGNTAEENAALRGIAGRIVDQQLAAEPAPSAIDVTIPEGGRMLTFTRSLQVDGGAPLELRLDLAREQQTGAGFGVGALFAISLLAGLSLRPRSKR